MPSLPPFPAFRPRKWPCATAEMLELHSIPRYPVVSAQRGAQTGTWRWSWRPELTRHLAGIDVSSLGLSFRLGSADSRSLYTLHHSASMTSTPLPLRGNIPHLVHRPLSNLSALPWVAANLTKPSPEERLGTPPPSPPSLPFYLHQRQSSECKEKSI